MYDDCYEKLKNPSISHVELEELVKTIKNTPTHLIGTSIHTPWEIYLKISEEKNCTDDIIRELANINLEKFLIIYGNDTYKLFDNGSKELFDDVWENGLARGLPFKFWKSKHTSPKQLEEIYSSLIPKNNPQVDKSWLERQRADFFKHPNAPEKILLKNIKSDKNLIMMASNPGLLKMPKIFEAVCDKAKDWKIRTLDTDDLVEALLTNHNLEWRVVANGIELGKLLTRVLSSQSMMSNFRIATILNFCKNPNCPDDIKKLLYNKTKNVDFLPEKVKNLIFF
jgi:hypothetical protein